MAVSKRLRYEVLRRDNHTCRYCGATAPSAPLHVDHVTPVALGGSDDPTNLVTACRDCNAGKTSVPVDATLVADVAQDALRWAAAMQQAAADLLLKEEPKLEYRKAFLAEWNRWGIDEGSDRRAKHLPDGWKVSIERFRVADLPAWMWAEIVDTSMGNSKVKWNSKFKYCAGIAWKKIQILQEEASRLVTTQRAVQPTRAATVEAITAAWAGSYLDQFGVSPTEAMLSSVEDLAATGFDTNVDPGGMLNAVVAGGACGEPAWGLFMREDAEFLAAVEEAFLVWRTCWMRNGVAPPNGSDADCFRTSVGQALSLDYTQYQIVQQAARTGRACRIDLAEDLKVAGNSPAGGEC